MKCVILAGGKGNSLWPLSRENYPKQFMQIREGRSLFQETVARNIPFCEEFLIITNAGYHFIVQGQMQVFQGVRYRCILEEEGRKTGPAIALACMCCNSSDLIFVVSSDHIIEGENYKEAVLEAQVMAKEGALVTFGMEALSPHTGYGYIRYRNQQVCSFHEKPDYDTALRYLKAKDYYWNSGNFLFNGGDFLQELHLYAPKVYEGCKKGMERVQKSKKEILIPREIMKSIPSVSVENAVFEKSEIVKVVKATFYWQDISDMAVLAANMSKNNAEGVIQEDCQDVTVINRTDRKLVVANHLSDVIIVNTEDVTYITDVHETENIKNIIKMNQDKYAPYFEDSTVIYRPWGTRETLTQTGNYKVKKVTVYPGKSMSFHRHEHRSEQWSVVEGTATITIGKLTREYRANESVFFPAGIPHMLANTTEEEVVIIEVAIGSIMSEKDLEYIGPGVARKSISETIIKCEPTFKDNLWGGTRLRDVFHKNCDYDTIAESWELSSHGDGQSAVAEGRYAGMLFDEYLKMIGAEALGWKCRAFERFPILIKFIDAKDQLSIQVHPDDDYALREEHEYGKNEMWYIMEAEPGATIYYGTKENLSKEGLRDKIQDNTILDVLNKIAVKKGDTFFVDAGTIHAIGAGILLCEIQQNSNCTYRIFDYNRRDKYGNLRELHQEKALEVVNLTPKEPALVSQNPIVQEEGYQTQLLGECKYFVNVKYMVDISAVIAIDDNSFRAVVFLEGRGTISQGKTMLEFVPGDTFFIQAGKKTVEVAGRCQFILTYV